MRLSIKLNNSLLTCGPEKTDEYSQGKLTVFDIKSLYFALNTILPKQGDDIFVIGSPFDIGLESTLTKGIVSHPNRIMEGLPFIQSDVNILGGNSGGPMIDMNGKVIGITVLGGTSELQGINLFIPIKSALEALSIKTN